MKKSIKTKALIWIGSALGVAATTAAIAAPLAITANQKNSSIVSNDSSSLAGFDSVSENGSSSSHVDAQNTGTSQEQVTKPVEQETTATRPTTTPSQTTGPVVSAPVTSQPVSRPSVPTPAAPAPARPATPTRPTTQVQQQAANLFALPLAKNESVSEESKPAVKPEDHKLPNRITKDFSDKVGLKTSKGYDRTKYDGKPGSYGSYVDGVENYQSNLFYNQRDFMPILSCKQNYNYANERMQNDVEFDIYYGWNINVTEKWYNGGFEILTYSATNELESVFGARPNIYAARIDLSDPNISKLDSKVVNEYIQNAVDKAKVKFVIINNPTQKQLESLVIPKGVEKLTIKDFDKRLDSLRRIQIPDTVKELEFYSAKAHRIDPTILSSNTHFIYDHISGFNMSRGNLEFSPFTVIDLSGRTDLDNAKLQDALDTVYGERQYERAFSGTWAGGYIYQLDISGTPITSLNNVFIPSQSDGRFNIAYVQWSSTNSSGTASITIGGSQKYPSNDANVGEWWDSTGNAEKTTKLVLRSDGEMEVSRVVTEVKGLWKKYPNANQLDITNVQLKSEYSVDDLSKALFAEWDARYAKYEGKKPVLTIIKGQENWTSEQAKVESSQNH